MPWKKNVGESRLQCSRVLVLDRRRHVDQERLEMSRWKTKEPSIDRRAELVGLTTQHRWMRSQIYGKGIRYEICNSESHFHL